MSAIHATTFLTTTYGKNMKKLFTILGVCYVAMALIMAQNQGVLSEPCDKNKEQRENRLGNNNKRSSCVNPQSSGFEGCTTYELYTPDEATTGRHGKVSNLVTKSRVPDFVDNCLIVWSSDYCSPCRKLKPTLEQLQKEGYTVYVIDYPSNRDLGKQCGVTVTPTCIIKTAGKEVKRFTGVVTAEQIKEYLKHEQSIDYVIW
jgi:thioredoxin 1